MTFSDDKSSNIRAGPTRQQDSINRQCQVVTDWDDSRITLQWLSADILFWWHIALLSCQIILIGENKIVHLVGLVMSRVDWETDTDIFLQWVGSCWFISFTHLPQRLLWQAGEKEKQKKKFCVSLREVWRGWCSLSSRICSAQFFALLWVFARVQFKRVKRVSRSTCCMLLMCSPSCGWAHFKTFLFEYRWPFSALRFCSHSFKVSCSLSHLPFTCPLFSSTQEAWDDYHFRK